MINKIKLFQGKVTLESVIKANESYFLELDIKKFAEIFDLDVFYIDSKPDDIPVPLTVNVNFNKKKISYNPFIKTLDVSGSYLFVDGILKFERYPQKSNSKVHLFISTIDHEATEGLKQPMPKLSSKSAKAVRELFSNKEQEEIVLKAIEDFKADPVGFQEFLKQQRNFPFDDKAAQELFDKITKKRK